MMKKENLENQFNTMVGGGPGGNADARAQRRKGGVVDFIALEKQLFQFDANNQLLWVEQKDEAGNVILDKDQNPLYERVLVEDKEKCPDNLVQDYYTMLSYMDAIDAAPNSYNAISDFGLEPTKKLGEMAKKSVDIQVKFSSQLNKMKAAQDSLHQSGIGEFMQSVANAAKAGGKKAGQVLGMFGKLINKLAPEKKEEKSEEQLARETMQAELPKVMQRMEELSKGIAGCEQGLVQIVAEASELGMARAICSRELALYIGCKAEVERRYNEIYIPEAQGYFDESNNMDDKLYLEEVINSKNQFLDRMLNLVSQKTLLDVQAQQMQVAIVNMQSQQTLIRSTVQNSLPHWNSMLAEMGFASSMLEAANLIKDSNDFSNHMVRINNEFRDKATEMTQQAQLQGIVDTSLILESAKKAQQQLEAGAEAFRQRQAEANKQIDAMLTSGENLLEAVEKTQKAQSTLDAAKSAGNDNATPGEAAKQRGAGRKPANGK